MEFVSVDSCLDGNRPAISKSELYKHWPPFFVARDIASFLGFVNFYSKCIPYFEHRAAPLRDLAKFEITAPVESMFILDHEAANKDLIGALVSDSCLTHHDPNTNFYLVTDYSDFEFGYEIAQPSDDPESLAAMHRKILGGDFEFFLAKSILYLRFISFSYRINATA